MDGGLLHGGDSALAYVGKYKQTGDDFLAIVQTKRHSNRANMPSVFGVDNVTIQIKGKASADRAVLIGTAPAAPGVTFKATLEKIAA